MTDQEKLCKMATALREYAEKLYWSNPTRKRDSDYYQYVADGFIQGFVAGYMKHRDDIIDLIDLKLKLL